MAHCLRADSCRTALAGATHMFTEIRRAHWFVGYEKIGNPRAERDPAYVARPGVKTTSYDRLKGHNAGAPKAIQTRIRK